MIRAIFLFAVLGIGLFAGTQFAGQQGYVLISIANTTIEMSVTTLVIFVVGILAILFGLEYLIKKSLNMTSTTWNWFSVRKLKRARRNTNEGIVKLLEGDWQAAEKKVTRWANHHDMPLLCYLIASEAAQEMGDDNKRDKYLQLAQQQDNSTLAVELTKARQQVRERDFEQSFVTLSALQNDYFSNPMVLSLLKITYINLKRWQLLLELLPRLAKAKLISSEEQAKLSKQAQCGLIAEVAKSKGSEGAIALWNSFSRKTRHDGDIVACLATQLIERQADSEAYSLVVESLKKQQNDALLQLIPTMNLADNYPAIVMLQGLIKKNPEDAVAHSVLANVYMGNEKWVDAQTHLEKALSIRADVSDYSALATVLEKQDLTHAANDVSRQALSLISTS
ncbi:heme biosynthesis protein HemY [Vibrio algarum]|uniref:Heme biosynthesis HemY N-terminal domain-containing protein n=1 Tax=Vibrio algarum TaxID=3020714 RepID=A0ABT4YMJ5_9VIBR|nr:heme biosynthesis HemY N-terminal domain-containing protein [Vibrio sp. KJ40-1]MDB1122665.1 heme biosynthesis HemY N-terminal domain-containing protein [Vibrio sp. KJ40-1]